MLKFILSLVLSFIFIASWGQEMPALPYLDKDAPKFMQLISKGNKNIYEITNAFEEYKKNHSTEKNNYTQYYKRFVRWSRPFVNENGIIEIPTSDQLREKENRLLKLRSKVSRNSNWTYVGPKSTYDLNGTTKVTWQTNIYSLDIFAGNSNILYAGGETGGVWKTTDKGLNWTLLTSNVIHDAFSAVKIDPLNSDIVYAATAGKIIKTINGGSSWSTIYTESGLNVREFAISNTNTSIIIAVSNKGLIRSNNAGSNWTKIFSQECWSVKKKEGSGTEFYVIRDNGSSSDFVFSTDSGSSWTASNTGWWTPAAGESMTGGIIATCPSNANKLYAYLCADGSNLYGYAGVWVSNNNGATWTNTHPTGAIGNSPTPYAIPGHTNLMANDGVLGFNQGFYDMAIVVNPSNDQELLAGGTSWFKSINGGSTWTSLGGYVGSLAFSHPDIQWLCASGNDLWIASDGGLNYSNNFGNTHEARMDGISGPDMWGFDSGWNEDILVGGRYHNGNMTYHQSFPAGKYYRMGGAESATGYVNPGPERRVYHSDIGGHKIKPGFGNGRTNFGVSQWPNESYAYYSNSDLVFHPNYYNTVYMGKDNFVMKSTDGGSNYQIIYTFPGTSSNQVLDIKISRSNPNVLYAAVWNGTDDIIWKTTDGGNNWTMTTQLPLPNNNDRAKIAISGEDHNVLWIALTYGSNGKKVYKSIDGGSSWTNLSSNLLNGITVSNIMAQYGTNGGVYIGTSAGVFYRNNTHTDWQVFSTGLPVSAETNKLKPFYKEGKIRNGCWGFGVWESPMFEPSSIQAMPTVASKTHFCKRDTAYFDDYSVLNHTNATWSWSFPGASYVSSNTVRNPKVKYNNSGVYDVTLTITQGAQVSTKTITSMIEVQNMCDVDTIPGMAMECFGTGIHGIVPDFSLPQTDSLTVTAWVKPLGPQPDYSAIFMNETGDAGGINFLGGNNSLGYHWPGGQWWWNSNLIPVENQWNFVALVVRPNGVTIYCNEQSATHNITLSPLDIQGFRIGNYKGWESRNTYMSVDEVAIYNRVLTTSEIRELRHLTKSSSIPGIKAYYQFNGGVSGIEYDKINLAHMSLLNNAPLLQSHAPIGKGVSKRLTINSGGLKDFEPTGVKMYFPNSSTYPAGEVVVSRINQLPDQSPTGTLPSCYWTVNNYGTNSTFTMPDSIVFFRTNNIANGCNPNDYRLFRRGIHAQGNTWGTHIDVAEYATPYISPKIRFSTNNNVTTFGQFITTRNTTSSGNNTLEICNGIDENCNGSIDENADLLVINGNDS
ncbi:MAG: hypothetical protein RLZZ546_1011, partial [Bacteroidota bacterium]